MYCPGAQKKELTPHIVVFCVERLLANNNKTGMMLLGRSPIAPSIPVNRIALWNGSVRNKYSATSVASYLNTDIRKTLLSGQYVYVRIPECDGFTVDSSLGEEEDGGEEWRG